MPRINVLPDNLADMIAAGEVVERPSSVIKEFVENSIDAGAKNITVEISCGGKTYMRVTDNGCGIDKDDIGKAFLSHATSKISKQSDLDSISTLGFRGEALASVGAVSRVQLLTRTPDSETGISCCFEGGVQKSADEAGCPVGTTLIVRDLFYNIPARLKFLKKDAQEGNYIAAVIERCALSHPDISFKFIRDSKQVLQTPGNGDLKSTIYAVYGKSFCDTLIPVSYELNGVSVSGFTSHPSNGKNSRSTQHFFVNGRYVKSPLFMSAIEAAYKNQILVGKFPQCVLFVRLPFNAVDVNVHPAKTEVRFFDEKRMFDSVYYAVLGALNADKTRPQATFSPAEVFKPQPERGEQLKLKPDAAVQKRESAPVGEQQTQPLHQFKITEYGNPVSGRDDAFNSPDGSEKTAFADDYMKPTVKIKEISSDTVSENLSSINKDAQIGIDAFCDDNSHQPPASSVQPADSPALRTETDFSENTAVDTGAQAAPDIPDFRIIGEAFKTYIFVELEGKLLMIDKHAAHERIIFERLRAENGISQQLLLIPVTVSLSPDEYSAVLENTDTLSELGFDVCDFGDRCVRINACPPELADDDPGAALTEIAGYLASHIKTLLPEKLDWIYHSMACRAAIKAGDTTSDYELKKFTEYLLAHDEIRCCPHGRPVAVEITRRELEKQFKRIV